MRGTVCAAGLGLLLALCGCTGRAAPVGAPVATRQPSPPRGLEVAGGCGDTPVRRGGMPEWTSSAGSIPDLPYVVSVEGNLVGVLFGAPLHVRPAPDGRSNKILWISREPRNSQPLGLTATLAGRPAVTTSQPANSGPGEIYPSIVDVPVPGCWHVTATWNGNTATLDLSYPS